MTTHKMSLQRKYFDMIFKGEKTIELRLFDDKRQKINIGDKIQFNASGSTAFFEVNVVGLVRAQTFERLFQIIPVQKCGFTGAQEAVKVMSEFYSKDMQQELGVLGIVVSF